MPSSFSPDGKRLAYSHFQAPDYGIWTLPLDLSDSEHPKPGKPELFLASKSVLNFPTVSPDGRWIAYDSSEAQTPQIFVRPFSAPSSIAGGKWQVSTDGGRYPMWSGNTHELLYLFRDGPKVVSYATNGESFMASQPRLWSQKFPTIQAGPPQLMPDGKHLVIGLASDTSTTRQTHVTFLLNFADELRRRIRAGK